MRLDIHPYVDPRDPWAVKPDRNYADYFNDKGPLFSYARTLFVEKILAYHEHDEIENDGYNLMST